MALMLAATAVTNIALVNLRSVRQPNLNCATYTWVAVGEIQHVQPPLEGTRFFRNADTQRTADASDGLGWCKPTTNHDPIGDDISSASGRCVADEGVGPVTSELQEAIAFEQTRCGPLRSHVGARAVECCDAHLVVETVRSLCQGRRLSPLQDPSIRRSCARGAAAR